MNKRKPTYQELETRLAAAESIVEALKDQEVDAVVGEDKIAFLLLREVEEALRISDAGFRAMFELSGAGIVQADTPGFRFTRVNQKFCEIVGYSAEELLAETYVGLTDPQDRRRDMRNLRRCFAVRPTHGLSRSVAFAKTEVSSGWASMGPFCGTIPAGPSGSWP